MGSEMTSNRLAMLGTHLICPTWPAIGDDKIQVTLNLHNNVLDSRQSRTQLVSQSHQLQQQRFLLAGAAGTFLTSTSCTDALTALLPL